MTATTRPAETAAARVPAAPLAPDGWAEHWDGYAAVYEDVAFGGAGVAWVAERELRALHDRLPATPTNVLDAGAGTGRVTRSLLAAGWDVTAMDLSAGMLAELRRRSPEVDTVIARLGTPLPLPDAAFDAVVSLRVLKYVDRPDVAFAELGRVLRPGGTAVIEVGNRRSVARWGYGDAPVNLLTVGEVASLAEAGGLELTTVVAGTRLPHRFWLSTGDGRRLAAGRVAEAGLDALLPRAALARSFVAAFRRR